MLGVIHTELIWAGITPPTVGHKTTCPECSNHRYKRDEKCLTIRTNPPSALCYHCQKEWEF